MHICFNLCLPNAPTFWLRIFKGLLHLPAPNKHVMCPGQLFFLFFNELGEISKITLSRFKERNKAEKNDFLKNQLILCNSCTKKNIADRGYVLKVSQLVLGPNNILTVIIHNFYTASPTQIQYHF